MQRIFSNETSGLSDLFPSTTIQNLPHWVFPSNRTASPKLNIHTSLVFFNLLRKILRNRSGVNGVKLVFFENEGSILWRIKLPPLGYLGNEKSRERFKFMKKEFDLSTIVNFFF